MRDVHLRFGIDRSTCQRSHLSLVFCECLQVIIHKDDTDLAYEISPMYRGSLALRAVNRWTRRRNFASLSRAVWVRQRRSKSAYTCSMIARSAWSWGNPRLTRHRVLRSVVLR